MTFLGGATSEPGRYHLVEKGCTYARYRSASRRISAEICVSFAQLQNTGDAAMTHEKSRKEAGNIGLSDKRRTDTHGEQQTVRATFCPFSCCVCVVESSFSGVHIRVDPAESSLASACGSDDVSDGGLGAKSWADVL